MLTRRGMTDYNGHASGGRLETPNELNGGSKWVEWRLKTTLLEAPNISGCFYKYLKNTIFLLGFSRKMCKFAAEIKTLTTKRQTEVCVE